MATLQNLTYDAPTVCPRSSDPFHIVSYCIEWVTTSWTHSTKPTGEYVYENVI